MNVSRIKICCIKSVAEARLAVERGAAALGLVSAMPSGPGVIPEELISDIAGTIPPGVASVLLTCATDTETIVAQQRRACVNALQLVDALPAGAHARLRRELPGIMLIQVVHVRGPGSIDEARSAAAGADALLLDSGNPGAAVRELGGTGRVHDWAFSRRIVEEVPKPVWLAGGLTAGNVAHAIARVRPFGVDVCSGVRDGDRLQRRKLDAFVAAVRDVRSGSEAAVV